jgi:uncharacterized RDD family membrane protein YckC
MYAEPEFESSTTESEEQQGAWRDEVASRLNSYKARHRRKVEGNYSMRFDFGAETAAPTRESVSAAIADKFHHDDEEVADTNFFRRANKEAIESATALESNPADFFTISDDALDADIAEPRLSDETEYEPIPLIGCETDNVIEPAYDPENDPDFDFNTPRDLDAPPRESRLKAAARKLIHFPKPSGMEPPYAPPAYEFAEPVLDRPRILDVPEDTMPTIRGPLFADIRLDDHHADEAAAPKFQPDIDVPLQVAAVSQRIFAGLIDSLLIAMASVVFGVIAWNMLPEIPHTKEMAVVAALVPVVFWFVYQFLFIVYAGQTTGMQMAQLHLSTFDGRHPSWRERRYRALAMLLSCISMGLGFIWSMVDEDMLCWHDKISRTYPVQHR